MGFINKIRHPSAPGFYQYNRGLVFNPGTENLGLEQRFTNPMVSFRGAGRLAGSLGIFNGPQVYFSRGVTQVGLGGIVAGQFANQPLLNPDLSSPE